MNDPCCGKGIDVAELEGRQRRLLWTVLAINVVTFVMMVAASWLSGSSAVLSGALDNLGDAVTYGLSIAVVGASTQAKARVGLFKGVLILSAALAVAVQIGWRLANPGVPVFEVMGVASILNLAANVACLWLLTPYKDNDVNMSSVWECSRNDVAEGVAVIVAAAAVGLTGAGWPDLLIASLLLLMFLRSSLRVLRAAWRDLRSEAPAAQSQAS
jgi:Co/Zn/Cd efflux system component